MQKILEKFQSQITKSQEGVALLWALITIAVLLAITGSMSGLIVKESRMSSGVDSSIQAYAAAESGIEHGAYIYNNRGAGLPVSPCPTGGAACVLEGDTSYYIDFQGETVIGTGKSGNTTRKIEKGISTGAESQPFVRTYNTNPFSEVSFTDSAEHSISWLDEAPTVAPNIDLPVTGSYTQLFKVRKNANGPGSFFAVGLAESEYNTDGTLVADPKKIMLVEQYDKLGIFVGLKSVSTITASLQPGYVNSSVLDVPAGGKDFYVEISYIENTAIQVIIREGSKDGACVAVFSVPVSGDFRFWKVRYEDSTVAWDSSTSSVNTGNEENFVYMGIKAPTVNTTSYPDDPQPPPPQVVLSDDFTTVSGDWIQTRFTSPSGGSPNSSLAANGSLYANYGTQVLDKWYGLYGTRTLSSPIAGDLDFEVAFDGVTALINNPSGAMGRMFIEVLDGAGGSMYSWELNDAWAMNEAGVNLSWKKNGSPVFQEFTPDNITPPFTATYSNYSNTVKFKKVGSTVYFYKDSTLVYSGPAASGSLSQIKVTFNAFGTYQTYVGNLNIGGVTVTKY